MELRRFYVNKNDISDNIITLSGDEFLHLSKVLRLKVGFKVIICANDGFEHNCTISFIDKDSATLIVDTKIKVEDKKNSLTLFCGLLKNNKLDFAIQKAVELGIDEIYPFVSQNTAETKINIIRANKIALESAKQCGSSYLTMIRDLVGFDDIINMFSDYDTVIFCYEKEKYNRIKDIQFEGKKIALVVGSEGGFQPEEVELVKIKNVKVVTLGKRILRAETADIVAVALTLDALGELDYE